MIPNCAATRHAHFVLDGCGPAYLEPPTLDDWPDVALGTPPASARAVDLDTSDPADVASLEARRDAAAERQDADRPRRRAQAHRRTCWRRARSCRSDFTNRVIYYVGPVDPVRDEVVGPAGPTTATRMDKFTEMMLAQTGLIGMIGKAERGPAGIEAIRKHKAPT